MASCRPTPYGILLTLHAHEAELIRFMGKELRALLERGGEEGPPFHAFSPSRQRRADPEAASAGLEDDMDAELWAHRLARIDAMGEALAGEVNSDGGLQVLLDEVRLDSWLAYLTDLRLLLAAAMGGDPPDDDESENENFEGRAYVFLSGLQEWLLAVWERGQRGEAQPPLA